VVGNSFCLSRSRHDRHGVGDLPMIMATCTHCGNLQGWELELHEKSSESCGVLYTIAGNVLNTKRETYPQPNPYATGYGRKIPTRYMVKYESGKRYETSRWRRVYIMQYGNAGSAYIFLRNKEVFLDSETEVKLRRMEGLFR